MRYRFLPLMVLLAFAGAVQAQQKWTLPMCIDYAMKNNISVKQIDLQTKIAALVLKQSKLGQIPNLGLSGGPSFNSGRTQDPTTFA